MSPSADCRLVLGPIVRYVDTTTATIGVQTSRPCRVRVLVGANVGSSPTFTVHGHHYALVNVVDLVPGSVIPYTVSLDDERVWPPQDSELPPSVVRVADDGAPLRLLWGSCRRAAGDDEAGTARLGVDALRSVALQLANTQPAEDSDSEPIAGGVAWPSQLLLLGDQIYADTPSRPMREFIERRRDASQAPGAELTDFTEYAEAYRLAWSEPVIRWLLSCVPSMMIFDDHDVRDDWNTSASWREQIRATSWWRTRITSGLASYWIYQHAGNLSPRQRATDIFGTLAASATATGVDIGADFDATPASIEDDSSYYSFSYGRRLAPVTLLMVDSRCARVLEPGNRDMLDAGSWQRLERQIIEDLADPATRHVVLASSLPVLLPPTLHYAEQWNEAVCEGAWGRWFTRSAERLRQALDLEHWSAFRRSFARLFTILAEAAAGRSGTPPASIQLLGGDVHFSYLMRARFRGITRSASPMYQMVCSPTRNPLARWMRYANFLAAWRWHIGLSRLVARTAGVRAPAVRWRRTRGLWFDNAIALSEFDGTRSRVRWLTIDARDSRRTTTLGEAQLS